MPILLAPDQAPTLDELLAAADTSGLTWHIDAGGDVLPRVAGLGTLAGAGASELAFLANPRYQSQLETSGAVAIIVAPAVASSHRAALIEAGKPGVPLVVCSEPYLLYTRIAQWFDRAMRGQLAREVHRSAVVGDVALGARVSVGPLAIIEDGAIIGDDVVIGAGCFIAAGTRIGVGSRLHPRVTLYRGVVMGERALIHSGAVIGADGFGFAPDKHNPNGLWSKIPQFGGVSIGNDVEIGANTTVDRGALEDTRIGDGVKLDNQIQIGHNTQIGAHTAMAGCVGVAGSAIIGERCTFGGSAMVLGHLKIVDDVHVSAASLVMSSIDKPGRYTGAFPLAEHRDWERNAAVLRQLARLRRRIQALEE